jgi:hypothetical protein
MSTNKLFALIALIVVGLLAAGTATIGFLPSITAFAIASTLVVFYLLVRVMQV